MEAEGACLREGGWTSEGDPVMGAVECHPLGPVETPQKEPMRLERSWEDAPLQPLTAPFSKTWLLDLECSPVTVTEEVTTWRKQCHPGGSSQGCCEALCFNICGLVTNSTGSWTRSKEIVSPPPPSDELLMHNICYCHWQNKPAFMSYLLSNVKALGNYFWVNFSVALFFFFSNIFIEV